jgi:hypothetical protein
MTDVVAFAYPTETGYAFGTVDVFGQVHAEACFTQTAGQVRDLLTAAAGRGAYTTGVLPSREVATAHAQGIATELWEDEA